MNRCLEKTDIPEWMTKRKDHPDPKKPRKELSPTTTDPKHAYRWWENTNSTNQGGDLSFSNKPQTIPHRKKPREQEEQIFYTLINTSPRKKNEKKNVAMAWIDYKKACNINPQSWIIDSLKVYKISNKIIKFIKKTMKNW